MNMATGPVDGAGATSERIPEPGTVQDRRLASLTPPDPRTEPPARTDPDYDEPEDPAPVDHPNIPAHWQQRLRPGPIPEPPDPPEDHDPPDRSGLHLDLPGLTNLLSQQGLRAAPPGSC